MRNSFRILTLAVLMLAPLSAASALDYVVDGDHSMVGFKVKHLGISTVTGKFSKVDGKFSFDPADIKSAKAEAKIDTASINTEQVKRDKHLRSPDFFDTDKFPQISFVSKEISEVSGNKFKVKGDLSIHGVTKSIVLDAEFGGATKDPWGNDRAAFEASGSINRKDFGLTWNKVLEAGGLLVGEDVKIVLEIEGIANKA